MSTKPRQFAELLAGARRGEERAKVELAPLLYEELRRLARGKAGAGAPLQPTALAHEAFLKLANSEVTFQDRAHFLALAARAMRMILVDAYRAQGRAKRGGGARQVTLDEGMAVQAHDDTLIELDEALSRLEAQDERKARILEMHYFGGLSYAEIAAETGLSEATVHRELRMAKAWLKSSMQPGGESG